MSESINSFDLPDVGMTGNVKLPPKEYAEEVAEETLEVAGEELTEERMAEKPVA